MSAIVIFVFFKQKTAYEMRISDWSSDVCSSDLHRPGGGAAVEPSRHGGLTWRAVLLRKQEPSEPGASLAILGSCFRRNTSDGSKIGRASCRERVCQYV